MCVTLNKKKEKLNSLIEKEKDLEFETEGHISNNCNNFSDLKVI